MVLCMRSGKRALSIIDGPANYTTLSARCQEKLIRHFTQKNRLTISARRFFIHIIMVSRLGGCIEAP